MKKIEQLFKALGNKKRLEILRLLLENNQKPYNVSDIALAIRLSLKSTSKHLQKLTQVDLLETHRSKSNTYYRINFNVGEIEKKLFSRIRKAI